MVAFTVNPRLKRTFVCDACGEEIVGRGNVCLVRQADAPPEEPVWHVHSRCVSNYTKHRGGGWEVIPFLSSRSALYVW